MRGGARQGAGRKRGIPNKRTTADRLAIEGGTSPLGYLLRLMRDDKADTALRLTAAKAAAPYCHQALKAVEVSGPEGGPISAKVVLTFD